MQPDSIIGQSIAGFVVQERLSFSTRSAVYRAYQPALNREVALKLTRIERRLGTDAAFQQRFEAAIEKMTDLSRRHVHVVPIYAYGVQPELLYMAMRLTDDSTLADWLAYHRPTPQTSQAGVLSGIFQAREARRDITPLLDSAVAIITQVGRALGDAHRHGILHYDLHPANVLLDASGNAHLTDFGLIVHLLGDDDASSVADAPQALLYASPEQLQGEPLTARSNVYTLGMMLYEMVAGRTPDVIEAGDSAAATRRQSVMPPPSAFNPDVPRGIENIIMKAIANDPRQRYGRVDEMVNDLNSRMGALFERLDIANMPEPSLPVQPAAPQQPDERRWLPAFSVSTMVAAAVIGGLMLLNTPIERTLTVLASRSAPAEELAPSPRLIRVAQHQLGEDGYIGYVACGTRTERDDIQEAMMQQAAGAYGLRLEISTGRGDTRLQARAAERAVEDGAAGLIHCVVGPRTVGQTLTDIAAQDVPVVVNSRAPVQGFEGGVYVTNNDYALGVASGRAAGQTIQAELGGTGRVLLVDDTRLRAEDDKPSLRAQGLRDGLLSAAPEALILDEYAAQSLTLGQQVIRQANADELRFNVVLSASDEVAYGIIRELDFAGYLPQDVAVFSIDGEAAARQLIADGQYLRASARPDYEAVVQASVNTLVLMLAGEAVPARVVPQQTTLITQQNAVSND